MSNPRFVLVIGGPRSASTLVSWPSATVPQRVPDDAGTWFAWRLLGGNNRELGRSAAAHRTPSLARAAAQVLRDTADTLSPAVLLDSGRGMWGWRLSGDDDVRAVSARLYLRQRECTYSLRQFLDTASTARLWDDGEGAGSDAGKRDDGARTVIDLTGPEPRVVVAPPEEPVADGRPLAAVPRRLPPAPARTTCAREQAEQIRRRPSPWPATVTPRPTAPSPT